MWSEDSRVPWNSGGACSSESLRNLTLVFCRGRKSGGDILVEVVVYRATDVWKMSLSLMFTSSCFGRLFTRGSYCVTINNSSADVTGDWKSVGSCAVHSKPISEFPTNRPHRLIVLSPEMETVSSGHEIRLLSEKMHWEVAPRRSLQLV